MAPTKDPKWEEQEHVNKIKEMFRQWDSDGNGVITKDELREVMTSILGNMTEWDINVLMDEADQSRDGLIQLDEFLNWLLSPPSENMVAIDYTEIFKPLFHVYDKNHSGFISKDEFMEAHGILQGALKLNPEEESESEDEGVDADPLLIQKNYDQAFKFCDMNNDDMMSMLEFVRFLKGQVPPNFRKEHLNEFVQELACVLNKIYHQISKIEKGIVSEHDLTLNKLVEQLASATREYEDAIEEAQEIADEQKTEQMKAASWTEPPVGLNIQRLKGMHLTFAPLNMRKFSDVSYGVLCLPSQEGYEDPQKRVWLAELVRKLKYKKSGKIVVESPWYYMYNREKFSWEPIGYDDEEVGKSAYRKAFDNLAIEIVIFCLLKTEANFGTELSWDGILHALGTAVDMKFLDQTQMDQYVKHMQENVEAQLHDDGVTADHESKDETRRSVEDFLKTKVVLRPRMVMATLSSLEIVKVRKEWCNYVYSD